MRASSTITCRSSTSAGRPRHGRSLRWSTGAWTLEQNYPNPFNPSTKIGFCVPAGQAGGWVGTADGRWVRLQVFDLLGREVATLVNERKDPGPYVVTFDASGLPGGVYLYRFSAGATTISRTMVLLR